MFAQFFVHLDADLSREIKVEVERCWGKATFTHDGVQQAQLDRGSGPRKKRHTYNRNASVIFGHDRSSLASELRGKEVVLHATQERRPAARREVRAIGSSRHEDKTPH